MFFKKKKKQKINNKLDKLLSLYNERFDECTNTYNKRIAELPCLKMIIRYCSERHIFKIIPEIDTSSSSDDLMFYVSNLENTITVCKPRAFLFGSSDYCFRESSTEPIDSLRYIYFPNCNQLNIKLYWIYKLYDISQETYNNFVQFLNKAKEEQRKIKEIMDTL